MPKGKTRSLYAKNSIFRVAKVRKIAKMVFLEDEKNLQCRFKCQVPQGHTQALPDCH